MSVKGCEKFSAFAWSFPLKESVCLAMETAPACHLTEE